MTKALFINGSPRKNGNTAQLLKPKVSATIYTMNCPNMEVYRRNGYDITMDASAHSLGMFGPTKIFYSFDTYQFNDYSRYDAAMIPAEHKKQMHETQFPKDLDRAYELGKRLVLSV